MRSMNECEQAKQIADDWLDFRMNSLVQMVHGDPDCDACVLARQYLRALDIIEELRVAASYEQPGPLQSRLR